MLKSVFVLGLVLSQLLGGTADAQAKTRALSDVCTTVTPMVNALVKNTAGGHISKRDRRYYGFSLICGKECPSTFPVPAYYSDGTLAFQFGYYGRWNGNGKARLYCGSGGTAKCSVATTKLAARKLGKNGVVRDGLIYVGFGGGACQTIVPGARNGSPY